MLLSATIKLPTANVAYNLKALAALVDTRFQTAKACREQSLQSDPSNTGNLYFGSSFVSAPGGPNTAGQTCGFKLLIGGADTRRAQSDTIPFSDFWVVSDTANQLVNILITLGTSA